MKWFFCNRETLVKGLLMTLAVLNFSHWLLSLIWILALVGALLLLRRNKVSYKDNFSFDHRIALSPVDGKIASVKKREGGGEPAQWEVRIAIKAWGPYGLYLPFDCFVEKVEGFKDRLIKARLTLIGKANDRLVMELGAEKALFSFSPRLYVNGGDKGKALACFGFFPMGSMVIKLPEGAKVTAAAGDKIRAGSTPIGTFS